MNDKHNGHDPTDTWNGHCYFICSPRDLGHVRTCMMQKKKNTFTTMTVRVHYWRDLYKNTSCHSHQTKTWLLCCRHLEKKLYCWHDPLRIYNQSIHNLQPMYSQFTTNVFTIYSQCIHNLQPMSIPLIHSSSERWVWARIFCVLCSCRQLNTGSPEECF